MADLFTIDQQASYAERIRQVTVLPLILWDTLQSCHRPGSLDSNINISSAQANDFPALLRQFPEIRAIAFNGAASEKYFRKLVVPILSAVSDIELLRMPSTSPANAGINFEQKLAAWRRILDFID
jgi:hypoxanthine-DNA glycosylase